MCLLLMMRSLNRLAKTAAQVVVKQIGGWMQSHAGSRTRQREESPANHPQALEPQVSRPLKQYDRTAGRLVPEITSLRPGLQDGDHDTLQVPPPLESPAH